MKKLLLTSALAIVSFFGLDAFAQTQVQTCPVDGKPCNERVCEKTKNICNDTCVNQNCDRKYCDRKDCDRKYCDRRDCHKKDGRNKKGRGYICNDQFSCLNISDAQRAELDSLQKNMIAEAKQRRANKQLNPATSPAEARDQRREAAKTAQADYLHKVRDIVGPEQYVVFLENLVLNGGKSSFGTPMRKEKMDRPQPMIKRGVAVDKADKKSDNKADKKKK